MKTKIGEVRSIFDLFESTSEPGNPWAIQKCKLCGEERVRDVTGHINFHKLVKELGLDTPAPVQPEDTEQS